MTATEGPPAAEKHGTGELRVDPGPLTDRFSALAEPDEVRWMSGTYGDPAAPGPSTYWIDAVVSLEAEEVNAMVDTYAPTPTGETPPVVSGLHEHLPPGPYLTGDALNAAFTEDRWWASAYLDPTAGVLVLVATGT